MNDALRQDLNPPRHALLALGKVGRPRGLRGDFIFWPYNPHTEALAQLERVWLAGEWRAIEHVGEAPRGYALKLAGIDALEQVRPLVHQEIFAARQDLPPLAAGEHYLEDLRGLDAYDAVSGERLGRVEGFTDTGAHVLIDLRTVSGKLCQIPTEGPFIAEVVPGEKILLNVLEGLIE